MKKFLLLSLLLIVVLLAGCSADNPPEVIAVEEDQPYRLISPAELAEIITTRPETFLLINLINPSDGIIPTTDLLIPFNQIAENLHLLPEDKSTEIIIYCNSNRTAYFAADALVLAGYTNLRLLEGGLMSWQGGGYPMELIP